MFQPIQAIATAGSGNEPPPQICAVGASSPDRAIHSAVDAGRTISADHLRLALVATRHCLGTAANADISRTRWAAMSNGIDSNRCGSRFDRWRNPIPPLFGPMDRGHITRVIDRVRSQGRDEVRRTFGCGIRALLASVPSSILRAGQ